MIMMSMLEASSNKKSLCSSRSNARKTPKTTPPAESDEVFKIQQESDDFFKIQQKRESDDFFKIQQKRESDEVFKIQQERER